MTETQAQAFYPVPLDDAVRLTELSPGKLRDLVRAGFLPCLLLRKPGTNCDEWFNVDDLRLARKLLKGLPDAGMDERRTIDTGDAVRAYLEENPPVADYDVALENTWPVMARGRSGRIYAHVQARPVAEFARTRLKDKPNAHFESSVVPALRRLGATQLRGIRGLTEGPQRWHMWWRLPLSMWSASPELESLMVSGLSAREQDEPVTVSRDRKDSYLRDPLRALGG